jgi:hypothetical protein
MLMTPRPSDGLHQVGDVEHRLAEEAARRPAFERQQAALDGADRGGGDVAVLGGELLGVVADVLQHRAQVLQVEQQQAVVVGDLEHQLQHAGLRVVEVEQAGEQQRPHVGDGGAHRVAGSPNTSQNTTGNSAPGGRRYQHRHPLLELRRPIRRAGPMEGSAIFCSVTVLPVPVAPVMRPWRLAIDGRAAARS